MYSERSASVILKTKKDGKLRIFIDYLDGLFASIGYEKVFTNLEAYSGYWQVQIRPGDKQKTRFVYHSGAYHHNPMPFGLVNYPAKFQRAYDIVHTKYKWNNPLIYLDNYILNSKSVFEHMNHVDEIVICLEATGVNLKPKKFQFFPSTVR